MIVDHCRHAFNDRAWKMAARDVPKYDESGQLVSVNLDLKNPNGPEDLEHLPPERLIDEILRKEKRILEIVEVIRLTLGADRP